MIALHTAPALQSEERFFGEGGRGVGTGVIEVTRQETILSLLHVVHYNVTYEAPLDRHCGTGKLESLADELEVYSNAEEIVS